MYINSFVLTIGNGTVESLWVRFKGQTSNVGLCYRPPSQDDVANELLFEELRDTSRSTGLVLMGDFNLPKINWEHQTADTIWSIRFLQNSDENFMEQILREPILKDALSALLFVNRVDLMNKMEIGVILATVTKK
ncbi:mitochondrial fission process protein 1 [Pitangus sulphuratus]|nr:mitochondrial fission process protein 1 [Pitangus sulphuratus]